jgi:hypothetical protein
MPIDTAMEDKVRQAVETAQHLIAAADLFLGAALLLCLVGVVNHSL